MLKTLLLTMFFMLITGCANRNLKETEVQELSNEFYSNLKYQDVKIKKRSVQDNPDFIAALDEYKKLEGVDETVITEIQTRPFVINNTIYYPKSSYQDDFYELIGSDDYEWSTFVHENCHAMYYQLKIPSKKHGGKPYSWRLGLWEQLTIKAPYLVPAPNKIEANDKLTDFGFEQQCQIFQLWALYQHSQYVEPYGKLIREALDIYGSGVSESKENKSRSIDSNRTIIEGDFSQIVSGIKATVKSAGELSHGCDKGELKIKEKLSNGERFH